MRSLRTPFVTQPPDDALDLTIAARVLGLVERLPHLVGVTDDRGRVLWVNTAGRTFVGAEPGQDLTTDQIFGDEVFDLYYAEIRPTVQRGEPWTGRLRVHRADGTLGTVDAVIVAEVGPGNEVRWLSTLAIDVTDQLEREAHLSHLASHDPLTGLPNRALLADRLDVARSVAARTGADVAVMALDLDGFKRINDTHGHEVGDQLLRQVTARLEAAVRPADTVARIGGDEFAVVIHPPEGPDTAEQVAERIRRHLADPPYVVGALELAATASIGLVVADPREDPALDELLALADRGMYRAKRSGGDCVRRVDIATESRAGRTADDVSRRLAQALARGQIVPAFDPVIDLTDGALTELRIEAGWEHPSEGLLHAEDFIDAALATGYVDLVWWSAVRAALRAVDAEQLDIPLDITLDEVQLRSSPLSERLATVRSFAPDARIRLELSGATILSLAAEGSDLGEILRAHGVELLLHHHGMTTLPLAVLADLPLAGVKLDPALTASINRDPEPVAAAARLARRLSVPCIATGVVHEDDLPLLARLGVDAVEGPVNGEQWDAVRLADEARRR